MVSLIWNRMPQRRRLCSRGRAAPGVASAKTARILPIQSVGTPRALNTRILTLGFLSILTSNVAKRAKKQPFLCNFSQIAKRAQEREGADLEGID